MTKAETEKLKADFSTASRHCDDVTRIAANQKSKHDADLARVKSELTMAAENYRNASTELRIAQAENEQYQAESVKLKALLAEVLEGFDGQAPAYIENIRRALK